MDKGELIKTINYQRNNMTKGSHQGGATKEKVDRGLARAVSSRLEEGNYKGAVRLLTSEEFLATL